MTWRIGLVVLGLMLCAWRFGTATMAAEDIRQNGEAVFFELAPVDPRALLLGDYMTLRYDLGTFEGGSGPDEDKRHGLAVIRITDSVGRIVRYNGLEKLAPDERLIRYQIDRRGRVTIGGEAYYFQSGTGERYEAAEYGIFRIMPDGRALLSGLADENREVIAIAGEHLP